MIKCNLLNLIAPNAGGTCFFFRPSIDNKTERRKSIKENCIVKKKKQVSENKVIYIVQMYIILKIKQLL